jgi:hypothetical protein
MHAAQEDIPNMPATTSQANPQRSHAGHYSLSPLEQYVKVLAIVSFGIFVIGALIGIMIGLDAVEKVGAYVAGLSSLVAFLWIGANLTFQQHELQNQVHVLATTASAAQQQLAMTLYIEAHKALARFLKDILHTYNLASHLTINSAAQAIADGAYEPLCDIFLKDLATEDKLAQITQETDLLLDDLTEFISLYNILKSEMNQLPNAVVVSELLMKNSPMSQVHNLFQSIINRMNLRD